MKTAESESHDALSMRYQNTSLYILETAYFTSKQSKKSFSSIEKCTSKIKVPQFLYCHYVCMYLCSLQPTSFVLASSNLNWDLYIWLSQNAFFCFSKFYFILELCPFFHFSQFSIYQGYEIADHDSQYIK